VQQFYSGEIFITIVNVEKRELGKV